MNTDINKFDSPQDRYKSIKLLDLIDHNGSCLDINKIKVGDILFLDNKDKKLCNGLFGRLSCIVTDIHESDGVIDVFCVGSILDSKENTCKNISIDVSYIDDKHIKLLNHNKDAYMTNKKYFITTRVQVGDYFPLKIKNNIPKSDDKEKFVDVDALIVSVTRDEILCIFLNPVKDDVHKIISLSITPNSILDELVYLRK